MSARAVRAEDIARALRGRRCSKGWICRCPAHDDHHPSLSVAETRDGKTLVKCWSGCRQDDVLHALRRRGLWSGKPSQTPQWRPKPSNFDAECAKSRDPMKTWRNAGPWVRGSAADTYLETRGIKLSEDEASSLRFAPALWHWPAQSRWPAMLARVSLATGAEIATHQTFVEPDGSGKAPLGKQARLFAAGGRTVGGGV
jgi:putative DNA primase/helicase